MRLLKVQGKGRVATEPDLLRLSFEVETKTKDYAECLKNLNMRTEELRSSMKAAGIDRTDLKTTSFSIRVETKYKDGRHIFVGYAASHMLHIELPVDKELLNTVLRHVARGHSGAEVKISFSVKDKESLRKRVLAEAVRIAQSNAQALAEASGIRIGKLQQMDYGWSEVRIYDRHANIAMSPSPPPPGYHADIEPEDVEAEDNVTLVYEIEG